MRGSPLAYPLTRGVDGDSGGAADLQTDVMRFMAILSLCLVAIFALVQSLPIEAEPTSEPVTVATESPAVGESAQTEEILQTEESPRIEKIEAVKPEAEVVKSVALTRPKWVSTFKSKEQPAPPMPKQEEKAFTLRFESDLALTRLVATGQIGFYAIDAGRAQRMTISDSRISFWDASTPNAFHEMEATTVPRPVLEALVRTGTNASGVAWGVTLPGKLRTQLDTLMQENTGGNLIIHADGNLRLESS